MACFSCSQKSTHTHIASSYVHTPCTGDRTQIEELILKINCTKAIYPSAKMNGAFRALLEMLQEENYCKYSLDQFYHLLSEFPNVC